MAKIFEARGKEGPLGREVVFVDGNPITDVISYKTESAACTKETIVTLTFYVSGNGFKCGDYKDPDPSYLDVLRDDMAQAKKRLQNADPEGEAVVLRELNEIAREISRYTAYLEANSKNEEQGDTTKDSDER